MRNTTILSRFLALTILVLITALIFQQIRSKPDGRPIVDKSSLTASVEKSQKVGGGAGGRDQDPQAETSGIHTEDVRKRIEGR